MVFGKRILARGYAERRELDAINRICAENRVKSGYPPVYKIEHVSRLIPSLHLKTIVSCRAYTF
jgi:hypothetical protein